MPTGLTIDKENVQLVKNILGETINGLSVYNALIQSLAPLSDPRTTDP